MYRVRDLVFANRAIKFTDGCYVEFVGGYGQVPDEHIYRFYGDSNFNVLTKSEDPEAQAPMYPTKKDSKEAMKDEANQKDFQRQGFLDEQVPAYAPSTMHNESDVVAEVSHAGLMGNALSGIGTTTKSDANVKVATGEEDMSAEESAKAHRETATTSGEITPQQQRSQENWSGDQPTQPKAQEYRIQKEQLPQENTNAIAEEKGSPEPREEKDMTDYEKQQQELAEKNQKATAGDKEEQAEVDRTKSTPDKQQEDRKTVINAAFAK